MGRGRCQNAWNCLAERLSAGSRRPLRPRPGSLRPRRRNIHPDRFRILVAYGAGGGTDTLARVIAPSLSRLIGKPVTVQNLPGGGGQVAATTLVRDGADGLAILATNEPDLFMSTVFSKPSYTASDFQVIMVDVFDPRILLVRKDSEIASFDDFVAAAKAQPGKFAISATQGGAQELFAKWLFARVGINVRTRRLQWRRSRSERHAGGRCCRNGRRQFRAHEHP